MRVRRPLARTIATLCVDRPEVIEPWLSDPRWYVVRNAVHILGWIGGASLARRLAGAARHPDARVRWEVVAALSQGGAEDARPVLAGMLAGAEPTLFVTILQQLAADGDASLQGVLLDLLREDRFPLRSDEERRALLVAIAGQGDRVVPALQAELESGGIFSRRREPDRTAIALCLARVGTPAAREVLQRGMRSGRRSIRKACRIAMSTGGGGDG